MGYVMMAGGARAKAPVNYKANFADNTWTQIISACQNNAVPDTWVIGSQKTMTINGTNYPIDIIGKNHDAYTAGGTAPLTFQLHDCYAQTYAMDSLGNEDGWEGCDMRTIYLPAIFETMPAIVKEAIQEVNKLTSAGNKSSVIKTTADKLFLLSCIEIGGSPGHSVAGEGTQYAYYKAGNSIVKYKNGSAINWWQRSPVTDNTSYYCCITSSGRYSYQGASNSTFGVSFAFCF